MGKPNSKLMLADLKDMADINNMICTLVSLVLKTVIIQVLWHV